MRPHRMQMLKSLAVWLREQIDQQGWDAEVVVDGTEALEALVADLEAVTS